ncbi:MAG TPA: LamG domain-containing protein [Gammaproteobacteria bacterium]|nr:LamG domain-containing protein [Gammaproteobacteria bacterium]
MNPAIEFLSAAGDRRALRVVLQCTVCLLAAMLLSACGGGASTETNPTAGLSNNTGNLGISAYTGPNAQTADIRAFQVNVWEPLRVPTKCGACHSPTVGQTPMFVRDDNVNDAYAAANPLIDLDNPAASRLVTKVAEGHNCWVSSPAACATAITGYIQDWAAGTAGGGKQILLTAPVIKDPGATLTFPATAAETAFASTVWPLVRGTAQCVNCHIDSSATKQQPYFASDDVDEAYEAIKSKINLNDPASSRVVIRLRDQFHNCWTGAAPADCVADGATMEAAIMAMIAGSPPILPNSVQAPTVFSKALTLADGVVASGGNRYEKDIIALYEFKTGSGNVAIDSSGVAPDLNLTFSPDPDTSSDIDWVGGWGISITNGRAQGSTTSSKKLRDLITSTGEYSIEAWVAPANVTQEGPARIVSYSAGTTARNFTLGQTQYNYDFLQRSSTTDGNGEPMLSTDDNDEDLQATLQHVVATFDPLNGRRIYVNGVFTGDTDTTAAGNLNDWDDTFAFVLGNEVSGDRQWQGTIRMVAIHNRALTQEQIQQNFDVGVGEKFFLLFSIGDVAGVPADSYIMFSVEQYDSYSYLFDKPTYINLDPNKTPGTIPLKGMSIGINGREASVGQAYRNLDISITDASYDPVNGQRLSPIGTIIPLENGADTDEFFLTFEVLGGASNPPPPEVAVPVPNVPAPAPASAIGVRTFDEINATMAAATGVSEQSVSSTFDTLRRQFPSVEDLQGFLSAHQMAVAQLAIAYCSAMVDDAALRAGFFNFGSTAAGDAFFTAPVVTAFNTAAGDSAEKNRILDALYDRIVGIPSAGGGNELLSAPLRSELKAELIGPNGVNANNLFEKLAGSCVNPGDAGCDAVRTRTVVKSMCAATLASAAMLVQ